jgi:hypothetical protein
MRRKTTHENDGAGTYLIRCVANGKVYVGSSSVSVVNRRINHFQLLRRGDHTARGMQDDFNTFGPNEFEFHPVLIASGQDVVEAEKALIAQYDATNPDRGYNTVKSPLKQ